jgi:hypothetical protein
MRDPYAVLGVSPGTDQRAIDTAYRRLCRRHHPDVSRDPNAGARMLEINAAYHVLRDPARRRAYDGVRAPRPSSAAAWQSAHKVWQQSARPPKPPPAAPPDTARLRVSPGVLDFGYLRAGDVATKRFVVRARDGGPVRARLLTRGDWLRVDRSELNGTDVVVQVTADPRELAAFWSGAGAETARIDGWLELVDDHGSTRVPAGAILRRDLPAAGWWNPFARRAG